MEIVLHACIPAHPYIVHGPRSRGARIAVRNWQVRQTVQLYDNDIDLELHAISASYLLMIVIF